VPPAPATIELDRIPVAVVLIALDGTSAELNPVACRLLAHPRAALIGAAAPAALGLGSVRWQALRLAAAQTGSAEDDLEIRGTPVRILVSPGELAGQPEPDAFIKKPFTARHLDGVIDEILQRRRSD
jgi:hypothetical protein